MIIILETLKQFRLWNKEKRNKFYQQFDLMGHSRGGEAIVIAYLFNQLNFLPEYPSKFLFNNSNFRIKVLFSIGGTADDCLPLGHSLQFSDVTLFALHRIYDADVTEFSFQSVLKNLKFTSSTYHFKASLYIHQANHVTIGTIVGSKINVTNLFLWSSVYLKTYHSVMLLLQPIKK